jgi:hypothetical protein
LVVAGWILVSKGIPYFLYDCADTELKTITGQVERAEILERRVGRHSSRTVKASLTLRDQPIRFVVSDQHPAFPRFTERSWRDSRVKLTVRAAEYANAERQITDGRENDLPSNHIFWHNTSHTEVSVWSLVRNNEWIIPFAVACQLEHQSASGRWGLMLFSLLLCGGVVWLYFTMLHPKLRKKRF